MYLGHALCMSRVFSGDAQVEYIYFIFMQWFSVASCVNEEIICSQVEF